MASKNNPEFDLNRLRRQRLHGALVAEYIAQRYGASEKVEWAIAGRDPVKLTRVRDPLGLQSAAAADKTIVDIRRIPSR